jgi:transcriptional regulator with XRE-family HTH domain
MAVDQGPVVQSAILRGELIRLRRDSGLTQGEVARALEWSPSKLIRIEGGHNSVTKVDLDALLNQYGVTSTVDREDFQQLNRSARLRGWWDSYRNEIDSPYLKYVGYEAGATFIRQFPGSVVPGLLQTAEYAEALTVCMNDAAGVPPVLKLRLQRQQELAQRSERPQQFYVLDEAVIRRHVGIKTDPTIMPNQLHHIADEATTNELITVRLIPFSSGEHAGLSAFTVLGFSNVVPDMVYLDPGRADLARLTGEDPQVAEYAANFETLFDLAMSEAESIAFIRAVADKMSGQAVLLR